jgi:uncharacterized protein YegP (UPF0339 family)
MRNAVKMATYKDKAGEYRWRAERSGRIVADSGEGYSRRDSALKAGKHLVKALSKGQVVFVAE